MTVRFSELVSRFSTPSDNRYNQTLRRLHEQNIPLIDLVNPKWYENGIAFPDSILDDAYQTALTKTREYQPDSHGQLGLRIAIADWYARRGEAVDPDEIFITPGSSFAYLILFRLLGDSAEVLCPVPSYPLFEDIAAVAGWKMTTFPLSPANGWSINPDWLANRISTNTRAICLISPHNPTGTILNSDELRAIGEVACRLQVPLIFDEVFCEFRFDETGQSFHGNFPRPQATDYPLVFWLNGFSKILGLPGHKIGWVVVKGNDYEAVQQAKQTLDHLIDTFLPVNETAQSAATEILSRDQGQFIDNESHKLAALLATRRKIVIDEARKSGVSINASSGGVYCIIDTPANRSAEQIAIDLMEQKHLIVHPGYYYDLPHEAIVITYLASESTLRQALPSLFSYLSQ